MSDFKHRKSWLSKPIQYIQLYNKSDVKSTNSRKKYEPNYFYTTMLLS